MTTLLTLILPSPVGDLTLVASPGGLRAVLWPEDRPGRVPSAEDDGALVGPEDAAAAQVVLDVASAQLDAWFAGTRADFDVPLDLVGTPFQVDVWHALVAIPRGETVSYGELAQRLGRPSGARAVGAAVGRNPVSVVVPCHRVVGATGALTGFAGGLDAKRWLLTHEGVLAPTLA